MYSEMLTFFPLNLYNVAELHDVLTASPHWPSPTVIKYTKMDFQCLLDALSSVRKTIIIIKVSKTFSHFLIRFKNLHMSTWQNNQKIIQPRAQSNQKKKEKKEKNGTCVISVKRTPWITHFFIQLEVAWTVMKCCYVHWNTHILGYSLWAGLV